MVIDTSLDVTVKKTYQKCATGKNKKRLKKDKRRNKD